MVFPDCSGLYLCYFSRLFEELNNNEVLTWPLVYPDLSPVKHLWDVLDKQVLFWKLEPQLIWKLWL